MVYDCIGCPTQVRRRLSGFHGDDLSIEDTPANLVASKNDFTSMFGIITSLGVRRQQQRRALPPHVADLNARSWRKMYNVNGSSELGSTVRPDQRKDK